MPIQRRTKKPRPAERLKLFRVTVEAFRTVFVEATTVERAAEIAEGETRFGELQFDGCEIIELTGTAREAAYGSGRILREF